MISQFEMTDLTLKSYLFGTEVSQLKDGIFISFWKKYVSDMARPNPMGRD